MRLRRKGTTDLKVPKPRLTHSHGYTILRCPNHPLASRRGSNHEYEHRVVFYDAHGEGPFDCHWCGQEVDWSNLHVDHLDDVKDHKALSFFQHQLSWFRIPTNGKKSMDAPIGQFVRHLRSHYVDFVGLNVTYSGNKSFHYHFAFSTHVLASRVENATSLRYGFHKAWETLAADMAGFAPLNIPDTERPDPAVRFSEHFRRLPGGLRLAGSNQFFGVPEGTPMPQLTMWESVTTRAAPGAKASVFDPANFTLASVPVAQRKGSSAPVSFSRGSDESAYCEEKMRAIYDGETVWPRFEGFVHVRGELRAHFTNSLSDKKPQSYMGEGFRTVMIQGDNPLFLTNDDSGRKMPRLPKPLGEMIALWTEEYRQRFMAPGGRERTDLEQSFAEDAKDRVTAMAAIGQVLDTLITSDIGQPAAHFMSAPEGISKSRSLIANTPRFQKLLEENGLPPLIMFAFGNCSASAPLAQIWGCG